MFALYAIVVVTFFYPIENITMMCDIIDHFIHTHLDNSIDSSIIHSKLFMFEYALFTSINLPKTAFIMNIMNGGLRLILFKS